VTKLVVVDADVLGRERTGDETYVRNLLRELPDVAGEAGLRVAAVTRHPSLVPEGVEAMELASSSQELRMSWALPRLLRRVGAALVHTQYAVPLRCPCPAVVTVHDLSFERDPSSMPSRDRAVFRRVVPRAVRRAARVITVSQRSQADLVELYGVDPERVVVTPNGVDPAFHPGEVEERGYVLAVGAIQPRKNQLAALSAAREAGLELRVVGPTRDRAVAEGLRRGGARLEGYVPIERLAELYRGAACLVQASRYEGFGLPVLEAMASGTPVVTVPDPALVEVVGDAAVIVEAERLADGIRAAIAQHDRLAWAGLERARAFTWRATAEATVAVYREALGA
jgi:glycosyltransferase involved in cell wall biosynthesis